MKRISEEQIEEIVTLINQRSIIEAKKKLKELEECTDKEILDELKKVSRDNGRSSLVEVSKIEEILVKFGGSKK